MAMKRTTRDGKMLNQRTADMLDRLEFNLLRDLRVVQGSYNAGGVAASGGTHDGGGAVDISVSGMSESEKHRVVLEGRKVGFAIWLRRSWQGPWAEHIHGIAIGDDELSSGARNQVTQYYNGRNGLANYGIDDGPRLKNIPVWPVPVQARINLLSARRQFKAKKPKYNLGVKRIQWVLSKKGYKVGVDGIAGPQTRAAYKAWQRKLKVKKPNGVPSRYTLKKLGAGYFDVGVIAWNRYLKRLALRKKK